MILLATKEKDSVWTFSACLFIEENLFVQLLDHVKEQATFWSHSITPHFTSHDLMRQAIHSALDWIIIYKTVSFLVMHGSYQLHTLSTDAELYLLHCHFNCQACHVPVSVSNKPRIRNEINCLLVDTERQLCNGSLNFSSQPYSFQEFFYTFP